MPIENGQAASKPYKATMFIYYVARGFSPMVKSDMYSKLINNLTSRCRSKAFSASCPFYFKVTCNILSAVTVAVVVFY